MPFAIPLYLDVYYPDNTSTNRQSLSWIHGGGFTGGKRTRPDIIEMAEYYVARGWVAPTTGKAATMNPHKDPRRSM